MPALLLPEAEQAVLRHPVLQGLSLTRLHPELTWAPSPAEVGSDLTQVSTSAKELLLTYTSSVRRGPEVLSSFLCYGVSLR